MTTREYAKNLFAQWSDDDFCNQPIFDKLFFQVLNGQRAVNAAGIQPINFTRWRKAMRDGEHLPAVRDLQAALVRMERRGFVFTDEDTGRCWCGPGSAATNWTSSPPCSWRRCASWPSSTHPSSPPCSPTSSTVWTSRR